VTDTADVRVVLLADHPELVRAVGRLRWTEWGYDDPSPDAWVAVTEREAGRDTLPVTLVAIDVDGSAVGAVGLDDADDALTEQEVAGRTPWLVGLVVGRDVRRRGLGRRLVGGLEDLARHRGDPRVWVVTGGDAAGFYRACGWIEVERRVTAREGLASEVLVRDLTG
jgi:GNAT superfamily N-acetyltransferase